MIENDIYCFISHLSLIYDKDWPQNALHREMWTERPLPCSGTSTSGQRSSELIILTSLSFFKKNVAAH